MAKKIKIVVSVVVLIFLLLVSGVIPTGKVNTHSNYYSDREINSAIFMAKLYFTLNFKGCDLINIDYAGDESIPAAEAWADDSHARKAIILTSSFNVDSSGGDGSLEPNKTYKGWQWIMISHLGLIYHHKTHGYG